MRTRSILLGLRGLLGLLAGTGAPARVQANGDCPATMSGGDNNTSNDAVHCPTVGGGRKNIASHGYTTVGGGVLNTASDLYATVAGGYGNTASAPYATIAGGGRSNFTDFTTGNRVTDEYGTVGGGGRNVAGSADADTNDAPYATVAGGYANVAAGDFTSVGGGWGNNASALYATVPGGYANLATGAYSFAAGRQAKATNNGSFVWGDNTAANITSTGPNQFIVRAKGGATFFTNGAATQGVTLPAGGGAWNTLSDRNAKANFAAVDGRTILEQLASIPIQAWNYKSQDASIRHIGPTAQDFAAAFNVGEDTTSISTVDADGVALAAIQGLYQENQELAQQNRDLQARVTTLEQTGAGARPAALGGLNLWVLLALVVGAVNLVLLRRRAVAAPSG